MCLVKNEFLLALYNSTKVKFKITKFQRDKFRGKGVTGYVFRVACYELRVVGCRVNGELPAIDIHLFLHA